MLLPFDRIHSNLANYLVLVLPTQDTSDGRLVHDGLSDPQCMSVDYPHVMASRDDFACGPCRCCGL